MRASTFIINYQNVYYKATDGKSYPMRDLYPLCMPVDPAFRLNGKKVPNDGDELFCLDNGQPMSDSSDFCVCKVMGKAIYRLQQDGAYRKIASGVEIRGEIKEGTPLALSALKPPINAKIAPYIEAVNTSKDLMEQYKGWLGLVSCFLHVSQEVLLDNEWSDIEYEGWLIEVLLAPDSISILYHDGNTYTVFDPDSLEIRKTRVTDLTDTCSDDPPWIRNPARWKFNDDSHCWNRIPMAPKAEGADCDHCPLQDVPICDASREDEVDVLFIGEAPGRDEMASAYAGEPQFFVGRAGQLLHAGIAQSGVGKYKCGFNNACICEVEGAPPADALKACRGRLLREIALAKPKLVVPVGAVALSVLMDQSIGITTEQGLIKTIELGKQPYKTVPCFHSAAVLRRPELFTDFMNALVKARMVLDNTPGIDVQPSAFDVKIATAENAVDYINEIASYPLIYADTETSGFNQFLDRILCITIGGRDESKPVEKARIFKWDIFEQNEEAMGALIKLLERRKVGYWNGEFDCQFLRQYGIDAEIGIDVMLKQYTQDERPLAQGLKPCARRYCNAPDWEAPIREYLPNKSTSFEVIPWDVLAKYTGLDVCYTGTIDYILDSLMDDDNKRLYSDILLPAANMLLYSCGTGIKIDTDQLPSLQKEYEDKIDARRKQLQELAGNSDFNPGSTKQALAFVKGVLGLPVSSTNRESMEPYMGFEGVAALMDFRSSSKILSTYILGIQNDMIDGRVYPNLRLNGTVTGRLSSGGRS